MIFKKTILKIKSSVVNRYFYSINENDSDTATKIKMYINIHNKYCKPENLITITKIELNKKDAK